MQTVMMKSSVCPRALGVSRPVNPTLGVNLAPVRPKVLARAAKDDKEPPAQEGENGGVRPQFRLRKPGARIEYGTSPASRLPALCLHPLSAPTQLPIQ